MKSHQMNHLAESTGNSNLAISWLQSHQMTKSLFIYFLEGNHYGILKKETVIDNTLTFDPNEKDELPF